MGLDHFEGRSWRGFHHHTTLCMVAHGFLALRRALFPRTRTSQKQVIAELQQLFLELKANPDVVYEAEDFGNLLEGMSKRPLIVTMSRLSLQ